MRKITQQEFDNLPSVGGVKQCPGYADYSDITTFEMCCNFGEHSLFAKGCRFSSDCRFGDWCDFGERSKFGELCRFGEWCTFGDWCTFGEGSKFRELCRFGEGCRFSRWCRFGESCSFGYDCHFADECHFGSGCRFGGGCSFGGHQFINKKVIMASLVGHASAIYIWRGKDGVDRFQIGCRLAEEQTLLGQTWVEHGKNPIYQEAINFLKKAADADADGGFDD